MVLFYIAYSNINPLTSKDSMAKKRNKQDQCSPLHRMVNIKSGLCSTGYFKYVLFFFPIYFSKSCTPPSKKGDRKLFFCKRHISNILGFTGHKVLWQLLNYNSLTIYKWLYMALFSKKKITKQWLYQPLLKGVSNTPLEDTWKFFVRLYISIVVLKSLHSFP